MNPVIITAAFTGPIATRADHLGLPTTPEELAPDNASLVKRLAGICTALERPVATVSQTRDILSLPRNTTRS